MRKSFVLLLSIIMCISAIIVLPSKASACSCVQLPSVEEEYERSDRVFSGKVLEIKEHKSRFGNAFKSVKFEVNRKWKGDMPIQASITTGVGGGDCGIGFSAGHEYLVYAVESDFYGEKSLVSTICDRTNELSLLPGDLLELGDGQPPIEKWDPSSKIENNRFYFWGAIIGALSIVAGLIFLKQKKGMNA